MDRARTGSLHCLAALSLMASALAHAAPGAEPPSKTAPPPAATKKGTQAMTPLQADLTPFIADADVSAVVVRITAIERADAPRPGWEAGRLTCRVEEVIHSTALKTTQTIAVPFERLANLQDRLKSGANRWNLVDLSAGNLFLLMCKPRTPMVWDALAALQIASEKAPEVAELRQCYQLEAFRGPEAKRRELFEEALTTKKQPLTTVNGVLRRYVLLDAIDRRGVLPREDGVAVIAKALTAEATSADEKVEAAGLLTHERFFDPEQGVERANERVLGLLVQGLVAESDPDRRARWVSYLSACLLNEFADDADKDRRIRLALIRSTGMPPSPKVAAILTEQAEHEANEDKKLTLELLEAWKAAARQEG